VTRLQFIRVDRHISQERLAIVAGVPQPVICLIERGTWNPNPDHLAALGRALHIAPELLLQEVTIPDSRPRYIEARTDERREVTR
jgi:transcriptional regulator with XRE-family HTH domain